MLMLDWHHKLKEDGVKVWCIGPGFLETDLGNGRESVKQKGAGHPSIGGRLIKSVAEGERDADVGKYITKDGVSPFWDVLKFVIGCRQSTESMMY